MTSHSRINAFIDAAFARSSSLCRAQFGDFVAEILVDDGARPQAFERALLQVDKAADVQFAIVTGDDATFRRVMPEPAAKVSVLSTPEVYAYWQPSPEPIFSVFDHSTRRGVTWFPETIAPSWAIGQPCVPLIHAVIADTGWCLAHAGAIGRNGSFLLLLGPGKAGKSTAALACARAGWDYAGDDLVLLHPGRKLVAPLFSSARLRHSGVEAFESLAATAAFAVSDDDGAPRYELRLPIAPKGGSVATILTLERAGAPEMRLGPARVTDYIGPLMWISMGRAPGYAERTAHKLLAAGRMAPALTVDTGTDPSAIPAGLLHLLEGAR